jgi:tetratricopeptide (TPR) repeat protein
MRTVLVVLALVGVAITGVAASVPPYDSSKLYPTEEDFRRATEVYRQALEANPKDSEAHHWLGAAWWETHVMFNNGLISYGADAIDRAIRQLELAVESDDTNLGAWQLLWVAYTTRDRVGQLRATQARRTVSTFPPGDDEKAGMAALKVLALSLDPKVAFRGVPPAVMRKGEVAVKYPPITTPADSLVVGDPASGLVYGFPCPSLPMIQRPTFFLTKEEAYQRAYKPATVCTPP